MYLLYDLYYISVCSIITLFHIQLNQKTYNSYQDAVSDSYFLEFMHFDMPQYTCRNYAYSKYNFLDNSFRSSLIGVSCMEGKIVQ